MFTIAGGIILAWVMIKFVFPVLGEWFARWVSK